MSAKKKGVRPSNLGEVIRTARKNGLFVLVEGEGRKLEYKFWDARTGKWVLTYYPGTQRWLANRQKNAEGHAPDYVAAIEAALRPHPQSLQD